MRLRIIIKKIVKIKINVECIPEGRDPNSRANGAETPYCFFGPFKRVHWSPLKFRCTFHLQALRRKQKKFLFAVK